MTKKTWILFTVICVAIIGGLIYMAKSNKLDVTDVDAWAIQTANEKNGNIAEHTLGDMKSKVIVIEYGDYQCPGCATAQPVLKTVMEKYKDKVGFVFRNYPLTSIHPNALAAASAAESAGLQGKFWEMHDKLYENQNTWNRLNGTDRTNYFVSLANEIGIDSEKLRANLNTDSKAIRQKINYDRAIGQTLDLTGTPSIFVNGKKISDTRFVGSKIDTSDNKQSNFVWADATALENLVIKPALKENGIAVEDTK